jgi:hypothetical protein
MTWPVTCPRCLRVSLRRCAGDRKPVCAHAYHDASDCDVCGWCLNGLPWPPVYRLQVPSLDPLHLAIERAVTQA